MAFGDFGNAFGGGSFSAGRSALVPGAFVSFTYRVPPEPPKKVKFGQPQVIKPPSNPNKQIMVLNPNWQNQVHGIDLSRITPAQVDVLKLVMDPETKNDPAKMNKYPLVADVLRRMNPPDAIKNPVAFYAMMVKPFLGNADAYRKYWPDRMYNLKTVQDSKVAGAVTNPKPLFSK